MRKHVLAALTATAIFALTAGFASTAVAHPAYPTRCGDCHGLSSSVLVSATPIGTSAMSTTYSIGVNNPFGTNGWAVFAGSTKVGGSAGSTSTIRLANGATYTVYGVSSNGISLLGYAATAVSPKSIAPLLHRYTYKFNLRKKVYKKLRAVLKNNATGRKYTVTVSKRGVATWSNLPAGSYRLSTLGNLRFKFKARTVRVG